MRNALPRLKQHKGSFFCAGYTIVELMVVFSVVTMLATAGTAAFIKYNQSQQLTLAAAGLANTIILARDRAVAQYKYPSLWRGTGVCVGKTLTGFSATVTIINNTYELFTICSTGADQTWVTIATTVLPQGVTIIYPDSASVTSLDIYSYVLSGGVNSLAWLVEGGSVYNTYTHVTLRGANGATKTINFYTDGRVVVN